MTEAQLLSGIVALAKWTGWLTYHTHRSDHSSPGFPDLVLVKPPRLVFAELKIERKHPTTSQWEWLGALGDVANAHDAQALKLSRALDAVDVGDMHDPHDALGLAYEAALPRPRVEVYVWRPSDWTSGRIDRLLKGAR